jgi:O-antigen ligase
MGLWIALLWVVIIGSRPISLWLNPGQAIESPEDYLEGSPLDRYIFLFFIVAGFITLLRRHVAWGKIIRSNRFVFILSIYFLISIVWSDYPFISLKRWIKDIGNIIIVLLILTEKDSSQAVKAVFMRYIYVVVPLSIAMIKYFPEIGRYYNRWTWEPSFCGVATDKNALGCIAIISGLVLVWSYLDSRDRVDKQMDKTDLFTHIGLLFCTLWLIIMSHSSTAIVCLILGVGILFFMRRPVAIGQIRHLGTYTIFFLTLIFLLYTIPSVLEAFVEMVGRNVTLTGRTDLWTDLLRMHINPIVGTGYQSFWLGDRAQYMWDKYYFHPNQAHNGYLETYLNGGVIGLSLLIAMIISTGSKLKKELMAGRSFGIFLFSFLVIALIYNWTEASFHGLSLIWLTVLLAALYCPNPSSVMSWNGAGMISAKRSMKIYAGELQSRNELRNA